MHKIRLDEGDIYQINKSTNAIKFAPEYGGGYVVEIEVFHQLRCLVGSSGSGKLRSKLKTQNMLRKLIYRDYYNTTEHMPRIFEVNPDVLRDHTGMTPLHSVLQKSLEFTLIVHSLIRSMH